MDDNSLTLGQPDDAELAAVLVADHVVHAEVAIVWMTDTADGWRVLYANPNAMEVLGVRTQAEVRALALPAGVDRLPTTVSRGLTGPELLSALRLVAGYASESSRQLDVRLGPRFQARRFATAGISGIKLVGRHGELAAELQRSAEAAQRIISSHFEHAGVEVFMKDLDGRYVFVNENFRAAWQRQGEDLTGLTDFEILGPELAVQYQEEDRQVLATNAPIEVEGVAGRVDGTHVFRVVKFPVHDADGQIVGVGGVATDVTDALRSQTALAVSEERFRLAFEYASEGFAVISLDNKVLQVNDRLCEIVGRSREELMRPSIESPERQEMFEEWAPAALATGHTAFNRVFTKPDGSKVYVRLSIAVVRSADGEPLHYVSMITDETERRALELRARQAEKLETVGQLAGGIAHDINNLLGGILGYAELVKSAQDDPEVIEQCEQVIGAALRASDYTSRLLSFARPTAQVADRFDLHEIVDEVVHMLRHSVDPGISVSVDLQAPNPVVDGNPSQLHGALLNLGLNARDAIDGEGTIKIATMTGRDSPWSVRVEVSDNGAGIPADRLDRVFDPFYTTKSKGRGTGLGLTSVLAAVHQHRGTVTVDSEEGRGSTFAIEVPVAQRRHRRGGTADDAGLSAGTRVLVVDDDDVVRFVVAEALRHAGCEVIEAADGTEAITELERQAAPPEAVVFDLRMPGMGGDALFAALQQRWPSIATVLMSGFGGDEDAEALRERGVGAVLQKPFRTDELLSTLARCVQLA
ncbi:MAG TPA: PAS domain-containing protein [Ilumatobacter sp.]|nr:PAS domain-containing protein [Ilumatobacter sp.]